MRHFSARMRRARNEVGVGIGVVSRIFSVTIACLESRPAGGPVAAGWMLHRLSIAERLQSQPDAHRFQQRGDTL